MMKWSEELRKMMNRFHTLKMVIIIITRFTEDKEYPVYCRKKGTLEAPEEVLLDVNKLAEGQEFCSVGPGNVSRDGKLLAYSVDTVSRRQYDIYFH